eukprot:s527_g17.t1
MFKIGLRRQTSVRWRGPGCGMTPSRASTPGALLQTPRSGVRQVPLVDLYRPRSEARRCLESEVVRRRGVASAVEKDPGARPPQTPARAASRGWVYSPTTWYRPRESVEPASRSTPATGFEVTCRETNVGDTVWVVGSVPELGSWEVKEGLQIVILSENGNARWEGTKNKDVQTFESKRTQVQCAFNSDDMLCATMKMTEKDLEAAGVKVMKAQMDPAPEPDPTPEAAAPPDPVPEAVQGGYPAAEVPERTVPLKTEDGPPMQKSQSRHLFRLSDGSMQMDMTKTPSLMMMDLNSFMEEAETGPSRFS